MHTLTPGKSAKRGKSGHGPGMACTKNLFVGLPAPPGPAASVTACTQSMAFFVRRTLLSI
jgi:hypothetical protein